MLEANQNLPAELALNRAVDASAADLGDKPPLVSPTVLSGDSSEASLAAGTLIQNSDAESDRHRVIQLRTRAFACLLVMLAAFTWAMSAVVPRNSNQALLPNDFVVDLNTATTAELNLLPGVGEKLAKQIVDYRTAQGGFQSIDELAQLRGIKEGRLMALRKYLSVSPLEKP